MHDTMHLVYPALPPMPGFGLTAGAMALRPVSGPEPRACSGGFLVDGALA